jgi:hypothetical protein
VTTKYYIREQKKFGKDIDNIGQEYDQISAGRWQAEYSQVYR